MNALRMGLVALKTAIVLASKHVIALFAMIVLAAWAVVLRRDTARRQHDGIKPRLVYGPFPLMNIKYMSKAMHRLGYEASTFVYHIYPAHTRADFDYLLDDFFPDGWWNQRPFSTLFDLIRPYIAFAWLLRRFDIFHSFFIGGFLSNTPLQLREVQLLHLAGKKVVVMPYGGDVAVPSHIQSLVFREGLMMNYPQLGRTERQTLRWIEYYSEQADFIVGCIFHSETLPRWDMLTTHYYPIDTEHWKASATLPSTRSDGAMTVVHAPNHRGLKGTEFFLAACRELQEEGYPLAVRLLEGVPNTEVKQAMLESDIVAEQFIHGYGLTAMEGMSLGKVVMSNLSDDHYYLVHRLYTGLDECPIVNTSIERIKEQLCLLITDPALRADRAKAGREYVLKYHSYAAVGAMWECIYRKIWYGEPLDLTLWHPDRTPIQQVS